MPYIAGKETRKILEKQIDKLLSLFIKYDVDDIGVMEFIFTKLLLGTCPIRFHHYNAIIGLLMTTMLEFHRRKIVPYEIKKCEENGDVF